jgi:hypothetical protein
MRIVGNEPLDGKVRAVASGTLSNGIAVIVNSDGTVSAVAGTSAGQAVGTATVFETGATNFTNATFDSANNKVVIVYEDDGSSDYGKAVVGTVNASNNSISFGTPVTFHSSSTLFTRAVFDSNAGKVVVLYKRDATGYARAVIGTVSGTSISFGSPVDIVSNTCYDLDACFDSTNNKIFVCGRDNAGSGTGAEFFGVVGTVSGTSISFGSFATIGNAAQTPGDPHCVYDSSANRVVVAWRNIDDGGKGYLAVGEISGTSVSFGSTTVFVDPVASQGNMLVFDSTAGKPVIIYSDQTDSYKGKAAVLEINTSTNGVTVNTPVTFEADAALRIGAAFDSYANKIIIAYSDIDNSWVCNMVSGQVSGTTINFDTPTVVDSSFIAYNDVVFDSNSNKAVNAYAVLSGEGRAIVFSAQSEVTNLDAENFIGLSDGAYSDGDSAVVNITGSIDRSQTGLTAATKYYVQDDGTLDTTEGSPSVFAGTAISSTELIVKG